MRWALARRLADGFATAEREAMSRALARASANANADAGSTSPIGRFMHQSSIVEIGATIPMDAAADLGRERRVTIVKEQPYMPSFCWNSRARNIHVTSLER